MYTNKLPISSPNNAFQFSSPKNDALETKLWANTRDYGVLKPILVAFAMIWKLFLSKNRINVGDFIRLGALISG